ncbi:MAG: hypothetical protein E2593_04050 [Stenotrophomonas sp.]|nr:hypothetical protein [Stenotrophomonas sp.]
MTDPVVTLRLKADNSALLPAVNGAEAAVKRMGASAQGAGSQAARGAADVTRLGTAAGATAERANAMAGALNSAKVAIASYGIVQVASGLSAMADGYANITSRLKLATASQREHAVAQAEVYAISQRTSTELDSTATLYARLAQSTAEYGISQQRQLALTQAINQTFAVSGASAVAASNTITQFSQALAGGTLRAEEFNSVVENAPRLAKALADGMGIGMGELRKQVNDGKVSVEAMVAALESQAGVIEAEFNQLPLTVERAMVQLRNAVTQTVGELSQDLGASSALANGIAFIADNMGLIEKAITAVAVAYGSKMAVALSQDLAGRVRAVAQARQQAVAELEAARAAEVHAAARVQLARAGMASAGGLAVAESALQAAQARTTAATQASSVALMAKAAAARAAGIAMAAFGGPVGLAVTALTLFVMWAKNSRDEAERLAESVSSGFQSAIETFQELNNETANKGFAGLASANKQLEDARQLVSNLTQEYADLNQSRDYWLSKGGALPAGMQESLDAAATKLEVARTKVDQLSEAQRNAIEVNRNLVLEKAGVTNATEAQRKSLEQLLLSQSNEGQTLQQNLPHLTKWATEVLGVEASNRLAKASFEDLGSSAAAAGAQIKAATEEIEKGLNQQINQLQLKMIEQTQGKAAAMRAGFLKTLADKGIDPTSAEAQALRALNETAIAATEQSERFTKATQAATQAQADAKRRTDEARRAQEQQTESQRRYTAEAALAAAQLQGPLAVAEVRHKQRVEELDTLLAKHNVTREAYNDLVKASARELAETTKELQDAQRGPQALIEAMGREISMLGMSVQARERLERQLHAEEEMRRAVAAANKAGADIDAQTTQGLIEQARAYADLSIVVERQAEVAREWADVGTRGVADFADLLSDKLSGGLDKSRSFFDEMKDIFRRGWRDILRTFLEQSMVRPIQSALQNMLSGALRGAAAGGGWMQAIAGAMGASGAGMAGAAAGGGTGIGDMVQIGGMLYKAIPASGISGGMIAGASYGAGALGALYGWQKGGDTVGKGLGAAAYGAAGYYGATAVGTVAAGYAAAGTAGAAAAGSAALAAIPVAGWVALAAIVVDKISGGKLFGTKYQTKETGQTINITEAGGSASAYAYQEGQKSLFRGKKRRTIDIDASDEAKESASQLYDVIKKTAEGAASALGVATVNIISGSFKAVYDKKGNLTSELSTVLGRTYSEGFEKFQQRLQAENIVAQVGQYDSTASQAAERWRSDAEALLGGAQFLLAAAADAKAGFNLLTDGSLLQLTNLVEDLAVDGESMLEAYGRIRSAAALMDDALALSSVALDKTREEVVRFAAGVVDAAGGLERATALWGGYFNRFYSDSERAALAAEKAQAAAKSALGNVGLDSADFGGAGGMAEFRRLFEQQLPNLSAEATVRWLEAASALAAMTDAQAALNDMLDNSELQQLLGGIRRELEEMDMTPLQIELANIARSMDESIATAQRLGASESELALIREHASRKSAQAINEEARAIAEAISSMSASVRVDILTLRRAGPGWEESGYQAGRLTDLRNQLAAGGDARTQLGLIDQIREATMSKFAAEEKAIRDAAAAQANAQAEQQRAAEAAHSEAMRSWEAQQAAAKRLGDYVDNMGLSNASPLTASQRFAEAQAQYQKALQSGDASAMQSAAQAYLDETRSMYGVSAQAVDIFNSVRATLGSRADALASAAQPVFSAPALESAIGGTTGAVADVEARINALRESAIAELQGLDELLAELGLSEEARFGNELEALTSRYAQAEVQHDETIVALDNAAQQQAQQQAEQAARDEALLAEIRAMNQQLQEQGKVSRSLLAEQERRLGQMLDRQSEEMARVGRSMERTVAGAMRQQ